MQKTVVKMRVQDPDGKLIPNVALQARLITTGVVQLDGFVDRSLVEGVTDETGVASISLWPNTEGASETQYRITAKNVSTGLFLLNEMVTVPASEVPVWLQDILLLPPPTPKDYDEATIALIQAAKIEITSSTEGAKAARDEAVAAKDIAVAAQDGVHADAVAAGASATAAGLSATEAAASATKAAASATASEKSSQDSKKYSLDAKGSADQASTTATLVADTLAAGVSAVRAAQEAAELANDGAVAAYDAATLATGAANAANTSVTGMTAQMVITNKQAEDAETASNKAISDSQAAVDQARSADSKATAAQTKLATLPDTFASPEQITALQGQVDDVVGTANAAKASAESSAAALGEYNTRISTAQSGANQANTAVGELSTKLNTTDTRVDALDLKVASMATSDAFIALQADVDAAQALANQNKGELVQVETKLGDHTTKITEAKGIADSALAKANANESEITIIKQSGGGGGGSDPRVNEITAQGWNIVKATTPAEVKTLLEITDSTDVQAGLDALALHVDDVALTAGQANTAATAAKTKVDQLAEDFEASDVNALRLQVSSLDTNVDTLTIRVKAMDNDGAIDFQALSDKIATITPEGWEIISAMDDGSVRTILGLGTAAVANAQTGSSDATVGALLKVGAFGLGSLGDVSNGSGLNIDLLTIPTGFYALRGYDYSGTLPADLQGLRNDADRFQLLSFNGGTEAKTTFQVITSGASNVPGIYLRKALTSVPAVWTDWFKIGGETDLTQVNADIAAAAAKADAAKTSADAATAGLAANTDAIDALDVRVTDVTTEVESAQIMAVRAESKADLALAIKDPGGSGSGGVGGVQLDIGAVVLLPTESYDGLLLTNGAVYPNTQSPELAAILNDGSAKIDVIDTATPTRLNPNDLTGITMEAKINGYTAFASSTASKKFAIYNSLGAEVFTSNAALTAPIYQTKNAVWTWSYPYCISGFKDGMFKVAQANGSNGSVKAVSVADGIDLLMGNANAGTWKTWNTDTGVLIESGKPTDIVTVTNALNVGDGYRFFIVGKKGTQFGLFEGHWSGTLAGVTWTLVQAMTKGNVLAGSVGSNNLYFGDDTLQYRFDLVANKITAITPCPATWATNYGSTTYAMDGFVYQNVAQAPTAGYYSADYGITWKLMSEIVNAGQAQIFAVYFDKDNLRVSTSSSNSVANGTTGQYQYNSVTMVDTEHFKVPVKTTSEVGYAYYIVDDMVAIGLPGGGGDGGSGSAGATGDFALKPTGSHSGWLAAGTYASATYPALAAVFGVVTGNFTVPAIASPLANFAYYAKT